MCAQTAKQNITIKKYANRRLYNTATSSYVTLEDLSTMVKDGNQFNVYDAKTSEDITRSVLTQIIVEEENKTDQENLLPISFLRQLIGFYGDNLQWMVPKYLEHSMEMLTGNQDQIRDYFSTSLSSMFPFGTTLEEMSKQNMSMFENALRMFSPMGGFDTLANPFATMTGTTTTTTSNSTPNHTNTSCDTTTCKTSNKSKSSDSCCAMNSNTTTSTKNTTDTDHTTSTQQMASVTNLKPRNSDTSTTSTTSSTTSTATTASTTTTPMPNVQNVTSSNNGADDMQQKIANLQRQLADLAKSRA